MSASTVSCVFACEELLYEPANRPTYGGTIKGENDSVEYKCGIIGRRDAALAVM